MPHYSSLIECLFSGDFKVYMNHFRKARYVYYILVRDLTLTVEQCLS